ncbi:uncharacterized protein [Lolium perenne]|uniref:uncharacterized protein n=1 Tax=Lolium perenne TaxID=4522 RepID=UPI003A9977C8
MASKVNWYQPGAAQSLRKVFAGGGADLRSPTSTVDGEAERLTKKQECGALEEDAAEDSRAASQSPGFGLRSLLLSFSQPSSFEQSTADARKQLFEELLWEHRDLAEAHSHCQVVPEATIEALKAQVAKLQGEKEQLIKEHHEALDAQKTSSRELKEQAMQAALQHEQALNDARVAAEARLAEVVEDSTNSNTVLTAELEEERKARKAAERLIDTMTTDHREYDRLVMKIDALALRKPLPCPFFRL